MCKSAFALCLLLAFGQLFAQTRTTNFTTLNSLLQSGPMVGYTEMREAMLWVQTKGPASVRFEYFILGSPSNSMKTEEYRTEKYSAYTARLVADQVQPGLTYGYRVYINDREVRVPQKLQFTTPANWRYRTAPPDLKFTLGSCSFVNDEKYDRIGKPYGGNYEIYQSIANQNPEMMLWLGDNIYFRESDWYSRTGVHHRYTHARSLPELQVLLGSTAHYAIWDDHDYGPNDSDRSYRDKDMTLEAFQFFWGNPTYGIGDMEGAITTFEKSDCQFFMLDNRYYRTPAGIKTTEPTILGKEQLDWLIEALVASQATFKFVCIGGQVVSDARQFETYANIAPKERDYLLKAISTNRVKNVVFLTGDVHHSELSMHSEGGGFRIFDFTVSPMTASAYDGSDWQNTKRVRSPRDTQYGGRAFGMVEVTGPENRRRLKMSLHDTNGVEIWSQLVDAQP